MGTLLNQLWSYTRNWAKRKGWTLFQEWAFFNSQDYSKLTLAKEKRKSDTKLQKVYIVSTSIYYSMLMTVLPCIFCCRKRLCLLCSSSCCLSLQYIYMRLESGGFWVLMSGWLVVVWARRCVWSIHVLVASVASISDLDIIFTEWDQHRFLFRRMMYIVWWVKIKEQSIICTICCQI